MKRDEINALGAMLRQLVQPGEVYVVVSVGAYGPNDEFDEGHAVATVRVGDAVATAEAKYLDDAIRLARCKATGEKLARGKPKKTQVAL